MKHSKKKMVSNRRGRRKWGEGGGGEVKGEKDEEGEENK